MKHFLFLLRMVGLPVIVAMLVLGAHMSVAHAQEIISSYKTDVVISADASARVTETIVYDFGAVPLSGVQARHGILRTIPLTIPQTNALIALSDISVTNAAGAPIPFTDSIANNVETIRIGDPNSTVTGAHTYVVSYTVQGGVRYFPDHDEWYWNAVGDQWPVAVQAASASIALPPSPVSAAPTSTCYTGVIGSRAQACTARIVDGAHAVFATTQPLASGQAFTIVMGFPKNIVAYAAPIVAATPPATGQQERPLWWGIVYGLVLIGVAIFIVVLLRKNRSSRPGSPIPQYTAPAGISPLEIAAMATDPMAKGLPAETVWLAARGYLTIKYIETKNLGIFSSHDFELTRASDKTPDQNAVTDVQLLQLLFPAGAQSIQLKDLTKQTGRMAIYKGYRDVVKGAYAQLVAKGYYAQSPEAVKLKYLGLGFAVVFFGSIISVLAFNAPGLIGMFAAGVILMKGVPWEMISATAQGKELYWYIQGLKLYIGVAEKDRIAFHDAPEKNPEHFQELLPYAIALGIEKQWAKKFDGLFTSDQMGWYSGPDAHMAPSLFAQSLTRGFAGSLLGAAGSSGSGGSGFSGGAGAGGGGGGGGGGSW